MSSLGRTIAGVFVLVGVGSFLWFGPSLFSYRGGRRGGHRELQDLGYVSRQKHQELFFMLVPRFPMLLDEPLTCCHDDVRQLDYLQIKQEVKEAGSYQAWLKKMAIERQRRREELRQVCGCKHIYSSIPHA